MKRFMIRVAYDGTNYCGYQIQPNAVTVEGVLNQTLNHLLNEKIVVIGASRTDSGVHALGNVAVFDSKTRIPGDKIKYALNQRLPQDIRVQESREVPLDFHPRHCVSIKTYQYRISSREVELPTERLYAYHTYRKIDILSMQKAASCLCGEHDFKSFCSAGSQVRETVRTIYSLDIDSKEDIITITITGNGFLYNMVRIITGTLLEVGFGMRSSASVKATLEKKDRQSAGPTAPAHGLRLVRIDYPDLEHNDSMGYRSFHSQQL